MTTVLFLAFAIASVTAALLNIDGSFKRPILAAVIFGGCFSGFSLIGIAALFEYQRYRLFLSDSEIKQIGLIKSSSVKIGDIHSAEWRTHPQGGSLLINSAETQLKIRFGQFVATDRNSMIDFLRNHISVDCQQNWDAFCERFLARKPERMRQQVRTRRMLSFCLLGFGVVFAIAGVVGLGKRFYVFSVLNFAVAGKALMAKKRPDNENSTG